MGYEARACMFLSSIYHKPAAVHVKRVENSAISCEIDKGKGLAGCLWLSKRQHGGTLRPSVTAVLLASRVTVWLEASCLKSKTCVGFLDVTGPNTNGLRASMMMPVACHTKPNRNK